MTEWVLVIGISVLVTLPSGGTIKEHATIESRPMQSEESCEQTARIAKLNIYLSNQRRAVKNGATITDMDLTHHCVDNPT